MQQIRRTFRFFGRFSLARKRVVADAQKTPARVLEIFEIDRDGDGKHRCFVRFTFDPVVSLDPPEQLPDPRYNIFNPSKTDEIIATLLKTGEDSFWICNPENLDGDFGGTTLTIFGAFCCDQFEQDDINFLADRFPLTAFFEMAGKARASAITFGQGPSSTSMRIELGFPLPSPLQSEDTAPVLPVGGLYSTDIRVNPDATPRKNADFLRSEAVLIGPIGATAVKFTEQRRLGRFGLANTSSINAIATNSYLPAARPLLEALGLPQSWDTANPASVGLHSCTNKDGKDENLEFSTSVSRDVHPSGERFTLAKPAAIGFPAHHLTLQTILSGSISDNDIEDAFADQSSLKLQSRTLIRWRDNARLSDKRFAASSPQEHTALTGGGIPEIARLMNAARDALATTDRQPQSIFADIYSATNSTRQMVAMVGYGPKRQRILALGGVIDAQSAKQTGLPNMRLTLDTKLSTASKANLGADIEIIADGFLAGDNRSKPLEIRLELPDLIGSGAALEVRFHGDPRMLKGETDIGFLSIQIDNPEKIDVNGSHALRLGSLAFSRTGSLLAPQSLAAPHSFLELRPRRRNVPDTRAPNRPEMEIHASLGLAIDSALPVTTDIAHGDRATRPDDLLVLESNKANPKKFDENPPFRLELLEKLSDGQNRHLTATLHDTSSSRDAPETFTLLSQRPWQVLRFTRAPLTDAGGADGSEVATYDSDARVWRLKRGADTYQYTLPAAVVGEAADKPGELELVDPKDMRPRPEDVPRPAAPDIRGVPQHRAVDMRLSPPSTLWIEPSDLVRNFFLAEYNARDIFRQKGDFGVGTAFAALRSEFVYGIATGVKAAEPTAKVPKPRVASIQALTGRMIGDRQSTEESELSSRWPTLRAAFLDYPERLEIVSIDTSRANPYQPAKFNTGLTNALRHTALLRPPAGLNPKDVNSDAAGPLLGVVRFTDHGLAGGALWPLESANVARVVAETPIGLDGELQGVALSPLGVSGDQSVRFVNGLVTVITETRDGHLHRHRVEVLGRISVFWHRAKHVVIYERTTAPSAQFAPVKQPERTRRPVLRKVEEFVEILEPTRQYPDMPDVDLRSRGFLEEVRFNSRIIHVNSAWGSDIGEKGWEVPLWNRQASILRPQVYPYPDIAFVTVAEGDTEAPQVSHDCLDAANLYFYTDPIAAKKLGINTDIWPVRAGVDFSPLANASVLDQLLNELDPQVSDKTRRTSASQIVPGLRRFTWRVAPAPTRTRLNAARGGKPLYATIDSLSLSRRPLNAQINPPVALLDALKTLNKKENRPKANSQLAVFPMSPEQPPVGVARYDTMANALGEVIAINENTSENDAIGILKKLTDATNNIAKKDLLNELEAALDGPLKKAKAVTNGATVALGAIKAVDKKECEALADSAARDILRRKLLITRMVRQAVADTLSELNDLALPTESELRDILDSEFDHAMKGVFAASKEGIGNLRSGVADARSIVADWQAQTKAVLSRASGRVSLLRRSYDVSKPWSRNRLNNALQQVWQTFDNAEHEAEATLDEARQRLATELDTFSRGVGARISTAMTQALAAEKKVLVNISSVDMALVDAATKVYDGLDKVPSKSEIESKLKKLKIASDKLGEHGKKAYEAIEAAIVNLDIDVVKTDAKVTVDNATKVSTKILGDIEKETRTASKNIQDKLTLADAQVQSIIATINVLSDDQFAHLRTLIRTLHSELSQGLGAVRDAADRFYLDWADEMAALDDAIGRAEEWAKSQIIALDKVAASGLGAADSWLAQVDDALGEAEKNLPGAISTAFNKEVIDPVVDAIFKLTIWPPTEVDAFRSTARAALTRLADDVEIRLDELETLTFAGIAELEVVCKAAMGLKEDLIDGIDETWNSIDKALERERDVLNKSISDLKNDLTDLLGDPEELKKRLKLIKGESDALLGSVTEVANQFAEAEDHARAYLGRGAEIVAQIGTAEPAELPGLALNLVSAATAAPEIAALKANADRIRMLLNEAEDTLKTSELKGLFDQIGDALKAFGLEFSFEEFGETLNIKPPDGNFLRNLLPDFGGIKLSDMLPSTKLPGGMTNAVKVTHDLDTKAGRAWVQADVDLPLPGREKMFSIGPFTLFLKDSELKAQVRAEASKNQKEVATRDFARLTTKIEAVVSGQIMVTLENVVIRYSTDTKLDFDIDPKKIRIHKSLQFVQDTLGTIFGDDAGGLKFIKENGIPVGVEHVFTMPPISLMYGTSGVSNIQLANRFSLRAYPDFVIADRFNLSRAELPFLFSFFIIGGTGYLQVDTEYRPFENSLMVVTEAGAGGSAALGFAFGPVNGSVFITISIVLRYQKRLGGPESPNDGLSVSLLLVIAGSVSLFGIVTVYLGLRLSISYHESGRVDGLGQITVEVRISRFFKLKYSAQITYQLRGGSSTTQVKENTEISGQAVDALNKAKALDKARKSL